MLTYQEAVNVLGDALRDGRVAERDRDFAASLYAATLRARVSEKQAFWIQKLADRIANPAAPQGSAVDVSGIYALLRSASARLKYPKIRVFGLSFYLSGSRSRVPGVLQVKRGADWLGRILESGEIQGAALSGESLDKVRRFAADPAGIAATERKASGRCCYCALELTDSRSLTAGYGPICASNWGLPWGA